MPTPKSAVIYRTGPLLSRGKDRSTSASSPSPAEEVNLRYTIDQMYKDIEKKENRNVALLKEVQTVRGEYANTQRELKITKGIFDKISGEKYSLERDLAHAKVYIKKLEACLERLEDPQKLINHASELQIHLESTRIELQQSYATLQDREERISVLQSDIDILQRTLDVKADFEGKTNLGIGKEAMRSLYFELGKRQADSQSLAVSLAQCNRALTVSNASLETAKSELMMLASQCEELRENNQILSQESIANKEEIDSLKQRLSQLNDNGMQQKKQIDDLSKRLSEERKLVQLSQNETVEMISSLADDLENEKREKEELLVTIESQRLQIDSLQAVAMKSSDMKSAESVKVEGLQLQLKSFEKQNSKLKSDNQGLLKERDELLGALEAERESRKAQHAEAMAQSSYDNPKIAEQDARILSLSSELSHAVSSLQQSVNSAKTMKVKFDEERSNRIFFEKRVRELEFEVEELKISKEMISSTILDSLHKEQEKTVSLERMLQSHVPYQENELSSSLVNRLCDLIDTDGTGHITSSNILYAISKEDSEALKLFQTLGLVPSAVDTAKALGFAKKLFVRYHDGANYGEFFEYLRSYKVASTSLVITPKTAMMAELEKMRNELRDIENAAPGTSPSPNKPRHFSEDEADLSVYAST